MQSGTKLLIVVGSIAAGIGVLYFVKKHNEATVDNRSDVSQLVDNVVKTKDAVTGAINSISDIFSIFIPGGGIAAPPPKM